MGKRKRSRSKSKEKDEDLWKKLRKIEKKLKKREKERPARERSLSSSSSPGTPPLPVEKVQISSEDTEDLTVEDIPEELLQALGKEGEDEKIVGEELQQQLADRWTNIIHQGLGKEAREQLTKKYPSPANFLAAVPPILNEEIAAAMNEGSKKRDKRIIFRQMLVGKMMVALGKALTSVLKGNLNTKQIVEQLNDSAKLAAEVLHLDSESRKFFALAGTNNVIKEAVKKVKTDEFLFGKNCGELIKAAQTIQKTGAQIQNKVKSRQENWKGPLQQPQSQQRSGQGQRTPAKPRTPQQAQRAQPRAPPRRKPQPPSRQPRDKYRRY